MLFIEKENVLQLVCGYKRLVNNNEVYFKLYTVSGVANVKVSPEDENNIKHHIINQQSYFIPATDIITHDN